MRLALSAVVFGAGFGFVLAWSRLAHPDVIHAMLRLQDLEPYLVMGSAIATAAIGTRLLRKRGARAWVDGRPVTWKTLLPGRHHVLGSAIFGLGWSLSNACPGPIAVQLGRGEWSAVFTALGFMGGIALRDAATARASERREAVRAGAPSAFTENAMCGETAS